MGRGEELVDDNSIIKTYRIRAKPTRLLQVEISVVGG